MQIEVVHPEEISKRGLEETPNPKVFISDREVIVLNDEGGAFLLTA
ncbi:MAG TPA: hypothetical protein VJ959_08305 [Desulfotignum sp.]|nr:hypothetical protein [Desulfotignum sp.]